jgi:hypothetical protein
VTGQVAAGKFVEHSAQDGDVHADPVPGVVRLGEFDKVAVNESVVGGGG